MGGGSQRLSRLFLIPDSGPGPWVVAGQERESTSVTELLDRIPCFGPSDRRESLEFISWDACVCVRIGWQGQPFAEQFEGRDLPWLAGLVEGC